MIPAALRKYTVRQFRKDKAANSMTRNWNWNQSRIRNTDLHVLWPLPVLQAFYHTNCTHPPPQGPEMGRSWIDLYTFLLTVATVCRYSADFILYHQCFCTPPVTTEKQTWDFSTCARVRACCAQAKTGTDRPPCVDSEKLKNGPWLSRSQTHTSCLTEWNTTAACRWPLLAPVIDGHHGHSSAMWWALLITWVMWR